MKTTHVPGIDFTRVFDLIQYQKQKFPNPKLIQQKEGSRWSSRGILHLETDVNALSSWFVSQGFRKGQKVLIVPFGGRYEWIVIDFACQQIGLVVVPVHPSSTEDEIKYISSEVQPAMCICYNMTQRNKFDHSINGIDSTPILVVHLDASEQDHFFDPFHSKEIIHSEFNGLNDIKETIAPDDLLAILYTSGSTGVPKGIMLTHANVVFNIKSILYFLPIEPGDKVVSFLPFSHVFERVMAYTYLAAGFSVYFSDARTSLTEDFKKVKPLFCTSVPRVLEKMINYVEAEKLKRTDLKRKIIEWSLKIGERYIPFDTSFRPGYRLKLFLARTLVLNHWKKALGSNLKYMVVGAAPLSPKISQLISATGIQIVEGYGMTEAAPFISANRFEPGLNKFGTVGLPIPGVNVKIDADTNEEGEVLVKGPNIMPGYWNQLQLTRDSFTEDGYFRTGDVGRYVDQYFLKITDRKKEIFKTSPGIYIAPSPVQQFFCSSPFILRCLILGFQKPFVTALIVPDYDILHAWCDREHIHWTSPIYMVHNIKVQDHYEKIIFDMNPQLKSHERIRKFYLCPEDWTADNGLATSSMKPIRKKIVERYQNEIDKMYEA